MPVVAKITSPWVIVLNVLAIARWSTGLFASLYARYLNPGLRVSSSSLSAVINGSATTMLFVFIDAQMSVMTDDVVEGGIYRLTASSLENSFASGFHKQDIPSPRA